MASVRTHISADELKDIFERSGLSVGQLGRIFGESERTVSAGLTRSGLQGELKGKQFELLAEAVAGFELQGVVELTPFVAFNSSKLPELVRAKLLSSKDGRSVLHSIMANLPRNQVIQANPLSVRDRLGVS